MTSKPAIVTSHLQEPDQNEPPEAAKIPLKRKGLDIASQMRSVKQVESDLAGAVGDYSTSVDHTLGVIEAIEATLQQKRRQIEEIQSRQEILALEYRQLGRSLETATTDLAQQFSDIIADLKTDKPAGPPPETAPETSEAGTELPAEKVEQMSATSTEAPAGTAPEKSAVITQSPAEKVPETSALGTEPPAEKVPETSAPGTEPPAEKAPESSEALDLDMELSDLPPVPEFLGGRQDSADQMDDSASRDTGLGSRPWWKHGKKG